MRGSEKAHGDVCGGLVSRGKPARLSGLSSADLLRPPNAPPVSETRPLARHLRERRIWDSRPLAGKNPQRNALFQKKKRERRPRLHCRRAEGSGSCCKPLGPALPPAPSRPPTGTAAEHGQTRPRLCKLGLNCTLTRSRGSW